MDSSPRPTSLPAASPTEREVRERLEATWLGARDGLWDWDLAAERLQLSPRWKELLGFAPGELVDRPEEWFKRVHPRDLEAFKRTLDTQASRPDEAFETEFRMLHKDGSWRWFLCRGRRHPDRTLLGGSISDVTAQKQRENELLVEAFHDPLTGLPNQRLFLDRLQLALGRRRQRDTLPIGVLYLDLDRFHTVNDSLGVDAGDNLLVEVTQRLTGLLRLGDTLARMGGDKFAVLLDGIREPKDAVEFAQELVGVLRKPLRIDGVEVISSGSLGIAVTADGTARPEDVLRDAITAMHRAKADGSTSFELFDPQMNANAKDRLRLEADLHHAIRRGEFLLHYQPIIDVQRGRIAAFEALVRWQHPQRGLVRPDAFIPIAEETGLVVPMGSWVLQEACRQMRAWQDTFREARDISVAVNLSARQLETTALVDEVAETLDTTGLDPRSLDLEMTESSVMARTSENAAMLAALRELGIKLSIDDFGTGYSSLANLQSFPLDFLKVDRSFVAGMEFDEGKVEIVRTVLALARSLGMQVVAEGIETVEALDMLRDLECEHGQGYYFSGPLDGESAAAWIRNPPRW